MLPRRKMEAARSDRKQQLCAWHWQGGGSASEGKNQQPGAKIPKILLEITLGRAPGRGEKGGGEGGGGKMLGGGGVPTLLAMLG